MRVLRLTNSNDMNAGIAPERRTGALVGGLLEARLGEPCEVQSRLYWPNARAPEFAERWVREFEPDVVLIGISEYWNTWESVPLMLRRRFGKAGGKLGDWSQRSVRISWLAENAAYRKARNLAVRVIGGATPFTVEESLAGVDGTVRRMLAAREETLIILRGPGAALNSAGDKAGARRGEVRLAQFVTGLRAIARQHRAEWVDLPPHLLWTADPGQLGGDRMHRNEAGHEMMALAEAEIVTAAWRKVSGGLPTAR
ncbi:MAG: hypothetical protein ACKVVT_17805 [Dehalococcoidia bacterium]